MRSPIVGAQDGFALIVVLAFLLLAASVATPFFLTARSDAFVARNLAASERNAYLMRSLLTMAAQRYFELASRAEDLPAGVVCSGPGSYPRVLISFVDHSGLIDLNAGSAELLRIGFTAIGAASGADGLAEMAERYRSVSFENSAADTALAVKGGLKHGPFESVTELLDFPLPENVSREQLDRVFTVQSRSGTIDAMKAGPELSATLQEGRRSDLPFVVMGANRLPALTVDVQLVTQSGAHFGEAATYVLSGLEGDVSRISSFQILDFADQGSAMTNPRSGCDQFFDLASRDLIGELLN